MSDIRKMIWACGEHAEWESPDCPYCEIDRLAAELAEARRQQTETNVDWINNQFKLQDVEEERDRYREALEKIADYSVMEDLVGIAREALEGIDEREADFRNNPSEFPNNGDMAKLRWMEFQACLQWFKLNEGTDE